MYSHRIVPITQSLVGVSPNGIKRKSSSNRDMASSFSMVNNADGLVKLAKSNSMTCLRNIEALRLDMRLDTQRGEEGQPSGWLPCQALHDG